MNLKKWRPISLLNVVYKLASAVISNRIKNVLDSTINENQKGFIAGRFPGENIRLIYDVLFEAKKQNIPGLLLSIDFEKAFDTVSWNFILDVLDYFNFGNSIKQWLVYFKKDLKHVFYKMVLCQMLSVSNEDVGKEIIYPHIYLSCVLKF